MDVASHRTVTAPDRPPGVAAAPLALAVRGVTKRFGASPVLRGVDLALEAGRITAFMGANGAGKSTLVKIVAGVHAPSSGTMTSRGEPFAPASPSDALSRGVVVVHQAIDDNVVLGMDVLENLMIDRLCAGGSVWFRRARMRGEARAMMARVGLDVPLDREVADLSLADRQMVAIARAFAHDPVLLILDEPTSALSDAEAERLFAVVEGLRDRGVAILYISHRLGDIRRLADRIVTLRDGRLTGDFHPPLEFEAAVHAMLGHALDEAAHEARAGGAAVLEAEGLVTAPGRPPLDLVLREGEVAAVVGLVGAGKTELGEALFGARSPVAGSMRLDGAPHAPRSPGQAIRRGVFLAPEDRAGGSLVPDFDLAQNVTLPFTARVSRAGVLVRGRERRVAARMIDRLGVVCRDETDPIGDLSGGNQQKVVLARWLSEPCRLLVLDEPFQGVDIAARRDIGAALRDTAQGRATLVLCADLDEALEVADRVLVMSHGALVGDHRVDALDREAVVRQMSGAAAPAPRFASVRAAAGATP